MEQLTKKEAIHFAESKAYEGMTDRQIAEFQIAQKKLCMPFEVFHGAISRVLERDVYTHEFGLNRDGLRAELFDGAEPPTLAEIIERIPTEKRMVAAI